MGQPTGRQNTIGALQASNLAPDTSNSDTHGPLRELYISSHPLLGATNNILAVGSDNVVVSVADIPDNDLVGQESPSVEISSSASRMKSVFNNGGHQGEVKNGDHTVEQLSEETPSKFTYSNDNLLPDNTTSTTSETNNKNQEIPLVMDNEKHQPKDQTRNFFPGLP